MERPVYPDHGGGPGHIRRWVAGRVACPYCYAARKGRSVTKGHYGWRPEVDRGRPSREGAGMKRPTDVASGGVHPEAWGDDLAADFPTLREYLCTTRWEDGKPRETATLLLVTEMGAWKACLNDRACSRSLWVTGESFQGVLRAVEDALTSSVPGWRAVKQWTPRK